MPSPKIVRAHEIVDPDALRVALATAAASGRQELMEQVRARLKSGRDEIERRFMDTQDGAMAHAANAYLMDNLIDALFRATLANVFHVANPTTGETLSVVAVGGYGRSELAPFSDLDLLFLLPYKRTPTIEKIVEFMLYILWDLGLKVGHATRSVSETLRQARADMTIRTSLLEARFICGDPTLFATLTKRFNAELIVGNGIAFVDAKLAERESRHQRLGDSRYVLEPNIKEGKGGLRDLHSLFWIAKCLLRIDSLEGLVQAGVLLKSEASHFERARNFLWTVRCHLHYLAGRAEERLTFDVQTEIGSRMGYTDHVGSRGVERFMKHYFLIAKDVGDLTRIFIAALEAEQKHSLGAPQKPLLSWEAEGGEGFVIDGGRLSIAHEHVFKTDPVNLMRLFVLASRLKLDIHPRALRVVTRSLRLIDAKLRQNPIANRLLLEILTSRDDAETGLRRLNEAGVLGRFLPDFGRVVAQMQYDMYHVHTVDEHSIIAVAMLQRLESGDLSAELPFTAPVSGSDSSRRALYVATFLHDVAKGRGDDHSELGARLSFKLCQRLGLGAEETETVSWLVKNHLLMSRIAFKRDLDDPKTIHDFAQIVQSPERLKLLLLLTVADIRAVGPKVWNNWKGELLWRLYRDAWIVMSGGVVAESIAGDIARRRAAVRELLTDFTDVEFNAFADRGYSYYWRSADLLTIARHARLMREAERTGAPLSVATRVDTARAITEVTVYTADTAGLFSRITGALAMAGAHIVDARIATMANGMALDTFWIQDIQGGAFDRPDKLAKLSVLFENVLSGRVVPRVELSRAPGLPSRSQVFTVPPRVLIDNRASTAHTVIEVNGRDRPALLHDLTHELTRLGLQINGAKITTYGEKVVDVFFLKNLFGLKVESERKLSEIRTALIAVLEMGRPAESPRVAAVGVPAPPLVRQPRNATA